MGVPCGEIKGVLHSEVDPKVAALLMSEDPELKPLPLTAGILWEAWGSKCNGSALPELWRDRNIGTGVLLGDMKGLAVGLCGRDACRGDMG